MTVSLPSTLAHSEDSPSYKTLPCHPYKGFYTVWPSLGSYKNSGYALSYLPSADKQPKQPQIIPESSLQR